ncbi:MAG: hypothetical protein ACXIUZ_14835 [Lysobacteraceae bacterium]
MGALRDALRVLYHGLPGPLQRLLRPLVAAVRWLRGAPAQPAKAIEPLAPGRQRALEVARAARAAFDAARFGEVLSVVDALDGCWDSEDLVCGDLLRARVLKARSLFALGRPGDCEQWLDRLEQAMGVTHETLLVRARLRQYQSRYADGLALVERALLLQPGKRFRIEDPSESILLKVELLTLLERRAEAATFFRGAFPAASALGPWVERKLSCLRRTVASPADLQAFKDYLLPLFAVDGQRALAALLQYSLAARDLGCHEEARAAIAHRFIQGTRQCGLGSRKRPPDRDWTASARTALLDLREDLDAAGVEFFLISGTLLGCIREGAILGHDKDIDVGVHADAGFDRVRAAVATSGRFAALPVITERILRLKHASGVMIDVFFHWLEDGRCWHEGQKTRWWNTPFDLVPADFLGERFLVPAQADLYLTENYGDWRVPQVDFETFSDTPNMELADLDELRWYYLRALFDHYHSGRIGLFEKVWSNLAGIHEPGGDLLLAVERVRRKALEAGRASQEEHP